MANTGRIHWLNEEPIGRGTYVLYWMQSVHPHMCGELPCKQSSSPADPPETLRLLQLRRHLWRHLTYPHR
ncbi:hypothetical protein EDD83_02640 [Methanohalophilus euhalobius]|uniref:Uncharacterized protein n=1 Tax=Methanohalophilus euhalobius TaxID=51203 RepID=A0A3M9LHD6_9EURY|nr:hypothetical protein EDD83_02640 [Methanohalophilus euhalobius]